MCRNLRLRLSWICYAPGITEPHPILFNSSSVTTPWTRTLPASFGIFSSSIAFWAAIIIKSSAAPAELRYQPALAPRDPFSPGRCTGEAGCSTRPNRRRAVVRKRRRWCRRRHQDSRLRYPVMGAKLPGGMNSTAAPRASPIAKPRSAPRLRSTLILSSL